MQVATRMPPNHRGTLRVAITMDVIRIVAAHAHGPILWVEPDEDYRAPRIHAPQPLL